MPYTNNDARMSTSTPELLDFTSDSGSCYTLDGLDNDQYDPDLHGLQPRVQPHTEVSGEGDEHENTITYYNRPVVKLPSIDLSSLGRHAQADRERPLGTPRNNIRHEGNPDTLIREVLEAEFQAKLKDAIGNLQLEHNQAVANHLAALDAKFADRVEKEFQQRMEHEVRRRVGRRMEKVKEEFEAKEKALREENRVQADHWKTATYELSQICPRGMPELTEIITAKVVEHNNLERAEWDAAKLEHDLQEAKEVEEWQKEREVELGKEVEAQRELVARMHMELTEVKRKTGQVYTWKYK